MGKKRLSMTRRQFMKYSMGGITAAAVGSLGIPLGHAAEVTEVTPNEGTVGMNLRISGTGFGTEKPTVTIGGCSCKVLTFSDTEILCELVKVPLAGTYDVIVTPKQGMPGLLAAAFSVRGPEITAFDPAQGFPNGEVAIHGKFFGKKVQVFIEYVDVNGQVQTAKCTVQGGATMSPETGESVAHTVLPKTVSPGWQTVRIENEIGVCSAGLRVTLERIHCLYNGWILTADPKRALAQGATTDRHRLYVLSALLIDAGTGKIAAVYPPLSEARPAAEYPQLLSENPAPPGVSKGQIIEHWRSIGVSKDLLSSAGWFDLKGTVATPGLIDDHFHVTSWSKKLPDPGKRFGFYADVGDPSYYTDPATLDRVCVRKALGKIVADAGNYLYEEQREVDKVFLHGYWYTDIDDPQPPPSPGEEPLDTHLFARNENPAVQDYDPLYLLNRIGRPTSYPLEPPENWDACVPGPISWPPLPPATAPAQLVHTSGQSCWYNGALLDRFNEDQETQLRDRFEEVAVASCTLSGGTTWEIVWAEPTPANFPPPVPFAVDIRIHDGVGAGPYTVPFQITAADAATRRLTGEPLHDKAAEKAPWGAPATLTMVPLYRMIVKSVPGPVWDAALEWEESPASNEDVSYGTWDPRRPHDTNWYSGAKRGLIQYFHDASSVPGAWRPTGYAEHYVIRDLLSYIVLDPITVEEAMRERRNLARWCHRHGLTSMQDIMFYRRSTSREEFEACEGLSFDHRGAARDFFSDTGLDKKVETGGLFLRVGLYYYLEKVDDVEKVLSLALDPERGSDMARLRPAADHSESPGWARWLGWKLQLDGGTGARTLFSNAPIQKSKPTVPFNVRDENGTRGVFNDHSFGLLTMTNEPEQVFTSLESAALYWLVRDENLKESWSILRNGVVNWLGKVVDDGKLETDLLGLLIPSYSTSPDAEFNVTLTTGQAHDLALKVKKLVAQVNDGYNETLNAIRRVWVEKSLHGGGDFPVPSQFVCHNIGDGAVDLYVHAIRALRDELGDLPTSWNALPDKWKEILADDEELGLVHRTFSGERYRVEHLLNVSASLFQELHGTGGIEAASTPATRNVALSTQPVLLLLDGQSFRENGFPAAQELWPIPNNDPGFWGGLNWRPRMEHAMPAPLYVEHDVPFTINTDPPSVRDPRPALTVIAAVARTPVEIDPSQWLDKTGDVPVERPPDYLAGRVENPLGLAPGAASNPMQLTVEQALSLMTFWAAYVARLDKEVGAFAVPEPGSGGPGWFADIVVWQANPLGILGPGGLGLEELGRMPAGTNDEVRLAMVNTFIQKFRPQMTIVGGVPVYVQK